jgi:DNA-binding beta-propeller fold protein YncE
LAHLGEGAVHVVDLQTLEAEQLAEDVEDVRGLALAPDRGLVYASATGTNELVGVDATSGEEQLRVTTGEFPDGMAYDPAHGVVVVSAKTIGEAAVHDAETGELMRSVPIGDEIGNVLYDQGSGEIYAAAVPDALVRLDPASGEQTSRVDLDACEGAHGVVIETEARLAVVACEANATVVVVDLERELQIDHLPVGDGPDVLALDPALDRMYVAAESGDVSVIDLDPSGSEVLGTDHLADGAHSVSVDPQTHRVFFPLEEGPTPRVYEPTD